MIKNKISKPIRANLAMTPYLVLGGLTFIYVLLRTIFIGITFDESLTIGVLVSKPFWEVLTYSPATANNHLLDSIFIKYLYLSGYKTIFVARLPKKDSFISGH